MDFFLSEEYSRNDIQILWVFDERRAYAALYVPVHLGGKNLFRRNVRK